MTNITEETKRDPERISIDFYVNEDHQYFLVDWKNGDKELTRIDDMTYAEIGELLIKTINESI